MVDEYEGRIRLAAEGRANTDPIPKVPDAGIVVTEGGMRWQVMHNGVMVLADGYYGAWMTRLIANLNGHHEPQEERVFHELLPYLGRASVMLELGSYWAYYSLWLKRFCPDASLYLLESDPRHLAVGMMNLWRNDVQATVIPGLIGHQNRAPTVIEMPTAPPYERGQPVMVPVFTLDGLLQELGLARVNVLHADVQGPEFDMLWGASDTLIGRKIDFLLISTHSDRLHTDCMDYLSDAGYRIAVQHTPAESFSVDGLIFAASPAMEEWPEPHIVRRGAVS